MKKMPYKKMSFIIALAAPLLILLGLTVKPLWTLTTGDNISLLTVPVDPRDLFYGDYVTLRYEIEDVPKEKLTTNLLKKLEADTSYKRVEVYGKLVQQGDIFILDELTDEKPTDTLYLTGKTANFPYLNEEGATIFDVNFNLNRFFVAENTGTELEDLSQQGRLVARIKVKNGYAILRAIEKAK